MEGIKQSVVGVATDAVATASFWVSACSIDPSGLPTDWLWDVDGKNQEQLQDSKCKDLGKAEFHSPRQVQRRREPRLEWSAHRTSGRG